MTNTTGNLFIVTAPSGAGKTSLVRAVLAADGQIKLSISYTTRQPRPGEVNGVDYHFVSEESFMRMLGDGEFLESAEVHGAHYGTSHAWVDSILNTGSDLLLEIDWQGAAQVRRLYPQAIGIFILPPSPEVLSQRLHQRGQDSAEVIARRLAAAREEISHVGEFDYVTINNQFNEAIRDMLAIVRAQRLRADKQLFQHVELLKMFQ
jgi:guanylate kinase